MDDFYFLICVPVYFPQGRGIRGGALFNSPERKLTFFCKSPNTEGESIVKQAHGKPRVGVGGIFKKHITITKY